MDIKPFAVFAQELDHVLMVTAGFRGNPLMLSKMEKNRLLLDAELEVSQNKFRNLLIPWDWPVHCEEDTNQRIFWLSREKLKNKKSLEIFNS